MKKEIAGRVLKIANYIISTKNTIRKTAQDFNISKSTVHKDISERLIEIDYDKYLKTKKILEEHIEIRHIIGGESTKLKYQRLKLLNER